MAIIKPNKKIRQIDGRAVEDAAGIANLIYNEVAGAQKNMQVGPFLTPLNDGTGGFTTDATSALSIRRGSSVAVYNKSTSLLSVTFGDTSAVASLSAGIADVSGNVGLACRPGDWTYFNSDEKGWIVAESADLLVYLIKDESYITYQG
jgi:hypothetical protein